MYVQWITFIAVFAPLCVRVLCIHLSRAQSNKCIGHSKEDSQDINVKIVIKTDLNKSPLFRALCCKTVVHEPNHAALGRHWIFVIHFKESFYNQFLPAGWKNTKF